MSVLRKGVSLFLFITVLFILPSCVSSNKPNIPNLESSASSSPSDTPSSTPDGIVQKGMYTKVTVSDNLIGLTLPNGEKEGATASITWDEEVSQLIVVLSDGSRLTKQFKQNDYAHQLLYLSAGDIDNDGYDELVVFLEAFGTTYGAGIPVVLKIVDDEFVIIKSPVESQPELESDALITFDPEYFSCNGAVIIKKGILRLEEEYTEIEEKNHQHRYYDVGYENDGWTVHENGFVDDLYWEQIYNGFING